MSLLPDPWSPEPGQVAPFRKTPSDGGDLLSPEAYLHTLSRGEPERLPALGPWIVVLLAVVVLLAAVSFPLWRDAVGELARLVADVHKLSG